MLRSSGLFQTLVLLCVVSLFSIVMISCDGDSTDSGVDGDEDNQTTDGDEEDAPSNGDEDAPVNAVYPEGPYGTEQGDTIEDLVFKDCDGNDVALSDFYNKADSILINQSAGWCTVCRGEVGTLQSWYNELKEDGVVIIQALNQNNSGQPANEDFCKAWKDGYGIDFPVLIDADDKLSAYEPEDTMPLNIVLNKEMSIQYIVTGGVPTEIKQRLTDLADE